MAQIAKVSQKVQLRSSGHKFYELLKNKMDFVFQMFPEVYKSWKVLEGNGLAHGSIIYLKYDVGEYLLIIVLIDFVLFSVNHLNYV